MSKKNEACKVSGDITVGEFAKKYGLPANSIRHANGRDVRDDKLMKNLRKEFAAS